MGTERGTHTSHMSLCLPCAFKDQGSRLILQGVELKEAVHALSERMSVRVYVCVFGCVCRCFMFRPGPT